MTGSFVKLKIGMANSRKLRGLATDTHRWGYVCILQSEMGSLWGLFRYPPALMAADLGVDIGTAIGVLVDLEIARLIERDEDDRLRVVGWFKASPPPNPSTVTGWCRDVMARRNGWPSSGDLLCRHVVEMIAVAQEASLSWNPATDQLREMEVTVRRTLAYLRRIDEGGLTRAVVEQNGHGVSTVYDMVVAAWPDIQDEKRLRREEKRRDREEIEISNVSPSGRTAREGKRAVPSDLKQAIGRMRKKATENGGAP